MGKSSGFGTPGWFQEVLAPLVKGAIPSVRQGDKSPGTVWSSKDAERAFARGEMNSQTDAGGKLRVGFRNNSKLPLILSWVAENGTCHHFYTLRPAEILHDGPITALDHIETTNLGHSFCIAFAGNEDGKVKQERKMDPKFVVGGYRPDSLGSTGTANSDTTTTRAHLVTISLEPVKNFSCCSPPRLRGSAYYPEEFGNNLHDDLCWVVHAKEAVVDDKQINTRETKVYRKTTLGGWPVYLEENWNGGDEALERRLAEDLECAAQCLPTHARDVLRQNTPVWVNRTFQYGPEICPIQGRGLCFHPEKDFLEENQMHLEKCECVELYNSKEYLEDCNYWGRAGVLIHEFSHAYHHKCLESGYSNKEILDCFEQAMKERLYDWVRVHGPQGPMNKAYACTNAMEYFAELSAAFLGQPDMNSSEEFNKWYPFNRRQIKEHDPRAYALLKKIWKVDE